MMKNQFGSINFVGFLYHFMLVPSLDAEVATGNRIALCWLRSIIFYADIYLKKPGGYQL